MIVGRTINYRMLRNPVAAHRARRSIWTPAALFAQGQQGAWYEPKPQYLFQDAAGTIPVTDDGDPVGYMRDLSGNGNGGEQQISASRLNYQAPSSLSSSGVQTYLDVLDNVPNTHPYASIGNQVSGFFAVRFDAFNALNDDDNWLISSTIHEIRNIGSRSGQKVPFSIGANGNNVAFGCASNYTSKSAKVMGTTPLQVGQKYIIGFVVDGSNLTLYLNGQVEATSSNLGTDSRSPSDGATNVTSRIASRTRDDGSPSDSLFGGIYGGIVIGRALSYLEADAVNQYLAAKAGVAL